MNEPFEKHGESQIAFMCHGCNQKHFINIGNGKPKWNFNGDWRRPTLTPSILIKGFEPSDNPEEFDDGTKDKPFVCRSFITEGKIQYLDDCTHQFAGETLELPGYTYD